MPTIAAHMQAENVCAISSTQCYTNAFGRVEICVQLQEQWFPGLIVPQNLWYIIYIIL